MHTVDGLTFSCFIRTLWMDLHSHVSYAHCGWTYILMFHMLEIAKLPICSLGMYRCLERSGQLLQGHSDIKSRVHGRAKSTSTEVCHQ